MIKIKTCNADKYYDLDGKKRNIIIDLSPGYTCLVGPNGTGKSTMIRQIRDILMREKDTETDRFLYKVIYYDNMQDGGSKHFGSWMMKGQFEKIAEVTSSSEGEGIMFHLGEFARKCGTATTEAIKENRKLIILIDGFDSGTSIDKINEFREDFINFIIDHCNGRGVEVYIIATANNYAMVDNEADCIIAKTGRHKIFKTYNSFKKFILANAKNRKE